MVRHDDEQRKADVTVMMFTSLNILVLTFFIYLIAISVIDKQKHKGALGSVMGAFNIVSPAIAGGKGAGGEKAGFSVKKQFVKTREDILKEMAASRGISDKIEIVKKGEDLVIRMQQSALFEEGKADVKPDIKPLLAYIGDWIKIRNLNASVEGHADSTPIHTDAFPSNWELSSARAVAILRFLVESAGVPKNLLVAKGFGQFQPITDNSSPEGREKNRRVEIILLGAKKRYARKGFWSWFDVAGEK